jgi:nicotinate-nucleotide--dimethylbenzimidazole phosphoribosyltransferase
MSAAIDLQALDAAVGIPSADAAQSAQERQASLIKPAGSLGRLEELSIWLSSVQGACPPRPLDRVSVVVFAGDHGVARSGVSAYPPEVTAQMVRACLAGAAGINALARLTGAAVRVVDLAVDIDWDSHSQGDAHPIPSAITEYKIRRSSDDLARGPALSSADATSAFLAGQQIADQEIDAGVDLLIPGDMGIGNTTAAAALTSVLTGTDVASVVGRGTGIDDATWMTKCAAVRDAARRGRLATGNMIELLAECGGADIAAMTGFLVQAAARRTPVLLDGVVSCAAALVAQRIAHRTRLWWIAGHLSPEPAHKAALERQRLTPVLDFSLRLGEGTGALLALPILRAAQVTLAEMSTFDQAAVSRPTHE